jgi:Tfp pilus assembly protein PilF
LAIIQAASYINQNVITLARYVLLLNQQDNGVLELLSQEFEDDWRYKELKNPVAMTWLISFEQIRRLNSLAADYLSFTSCIDPREIPESLLLQGGNISDIQRHNALGLLKSYSFITEQANGRLMSIHRLVHLAMRNWLRKEGRLYDWTMQARKRLAEVFPSDAPGNRLLWREYLPHAQFILLSAEAREETQHRQELSHKVGKCLYSDGRYHEAAALFEEVSKTREGVLGLDHPDTLKSISDLGWALTRQGRHKEAEEKHRRALARREVVLGSHHPDTLRSVNDLGAVLDEQGKYEEAEAMHRRALAENEKVLRPNHPDTLRSINNLGWLLHRQKEYEEAETMHRRALPGREKELGPDHPDTLRSVNHLGLALVGQKKYKEAEEMYRRALDGKERLLGADHPDTLVSMWNLSDIWKKQGREDDALELLQTCVRHQHEKLGPSHPHTMSATAELHWQNQRKHGKRGGIIYPLFRKP